MLTCESPGFVRWDPDSGKIFKLERGIGGISGTLIVSLSFFSKGVQSRSILHIIYRIVAASLPDLSVPGKSLTVPSIEASQPPLPSFFSSQSGFAVIFSLQMPRAYQGLSGCICSHSPFKAHRRCPFFFFVNCSQP